MAKYVVIRTDTDREIVTVGKASSHEEARTMLRNDFEFWLKQKWDYPSNAYDIYNEEMEEYGCYDDDDECSIADDRDTAWLNNCRHTNFDWTIIDTATEDILTKPLSMKQMILATSEDGHYVGGNIVVDTSDIIGLDLDGFLDLLSERLTGSPLLMDTRYKLIDATDSGEAIFHVMGDASEILEFNDELFEELKHAILSGSREDVEEFTGYDPMDYHFEEYCDNIFESTVEEMSDEELIRYYRKYCNSQSN